MTRRGMMVFTLALMACEGDLDRAVDPVWGKQPCEHCKMILSQRQSAAQLVRDGQRFYFDDIGCMAQWLDEHKGPAGRPSGQSISARAWVRLGEGWVDAEQARYQDGAMTPMDHGFVAAPNGNVTWTQLRARIAAKGGQP